MSISVRAAYFGVHIPPAGAGAPILAQRNVVTPVVLTTESPRSTSRGTGNHYSQIMLLPLIAGQYSNVKLPVLGFDEYVYLRRPNGTLVYEADTPGNYKFTPDVTGDWTYEVTTFSPDVTGSCSLIWNRVPLESELAFTPPGSYPFTLDDGWLGTANTTGLRSAYFKLNQTSAPSGTITINITGETFDDDFYLMDSALVVLNESDLLPITRSSSPGVYYCICRAWFNVETGSATFVWSLA